MAGKNIRLLRASASPTSFSDQRQVDPIGIMFDTTEPAEGENVGRTSMFTKLA